MTARELQELLARFSDARAEFRYFEDRYALMLLSWFVQEGRRITDIKASQFRGLLQKPLMRRIAARAARGMLAADELSGEDVAPVHEYSVTMGSWGCEEMEEACSCCQVTRPGKNLVLHLNFPQSHNRLFERLVRPSGEHPFLMSGHPSADAPEQTMAWARIDLDLDAGEALIEEIQCDWIRYAHRAMRTARSVQQGGGTVEWFRDLLEHAGCEPAEMIQYWEEGLLPHARIWSEAMLAAALWYLVDVIGIQRIFFHTYEDGIHLKGGHVDPPRSLYETLPRSFGFRRTHDMPAFLFFERMPMMFYLERSGFCPFEVGEERTDAPQFYLLDFDTSVSEHPALCH